MSKFSIKRLSEIRDPEFGSQYLNIEALKLSSRYYQEYYKSEYLDHSFLVCYEEKVLGVVFVNQISQEFTSPNNGIIIALFTKDLDEKKLIYNEIVEYLNSLCETHKGKTISIRDNIVGGKISKLGEKLLSHNYNASLYFDMKVDFELFDSATYFKNIRRRYKSWINWGKKNLEIEFINKGNLSKENFDNFKKFHLKIAGRQTRSDDTWNTQYDQICQGTSELILGYLNKELVAGAIFFDQHHVSLYGTGVYERSLFDYGVSHYIIFLGICRSFERGKTNSFSFGLLDTNITDPKIKNLQFFKKGFSDSLEPIFLWRKVEVCNETREFESSSNELKGDERKYG